jgi:hypothetical protein
MELISCHRFAQIGYKQATKATYTNIHDPLGIITEVLISYQKLDKFMFHETESIFQSCFPGM